MSPDLVFLAIIHLVFLPSFFLQLLSSTNTFSGRTRTSNIRKVRTALGNTPEGQATVWGVCFRIEEASSLFSLLYLLSVQCLTDRVAGLVRHDGRGGKVE